MVAFARSVPVASKTDQRLMGRCMEPRGAIYLIVVDVIHGFALRNLLGSTVSKRACCGLKFSSKVIVLANRWESAM